MSQTIEQAVRVLKLHVFDRDPFARIPESVPQTHVETVAEVPDDLSDEDFWFWIKPAANVLAHGAAKKGFPMLHATWSIEAREPEGLIIRILTTRDTALLLEAVAV